MTDNSLEAALRAALWRQFGAAIDMLDNALVACPAPLWTERLWYSTPREPFPPQFAQFWYVAYHALVWLELYLAGIPEEDFAPPAPFIRGEIDSGETTPAEPYTKDQLRAYLAALRQACGRRFAGLSEAEMRRPVAYPWSRGQPVRYVELQLYNLRHLQEHVAQLSLFLGQHGVPDAQIAAIPRARDDAGG